MISFQANTWFVTGATGLVGSSIVRELKRNELNVIALVRDQSPQDMIDLLTRLEVKIVVGDLLDRSTYAEYIATCDVVVHAAAAVQIRDEETNWKVNLEGTRSICEAMQEMGKTRIIYISTAGLYGGSSLDPVKEETPINPFGPYLESKAAAEDLILNSNRGLSATIIRPPFIFGDPKVDRHTLPSLIDGLPGRILPRIWRRNPLLGFVHGEDIARLVILAGSRYQTPSTIYNIQSLEISVNELMEMVNKARNGNAISFPIPYSLLYGVGAIGDFVSNIKNKPFGLRKRIALFRKNWIFSMDRANKDLGFKVIHQDRGEIERVMSEYFLMEQGKDDEINITQLVNMNEIGN